jgi:hypothetical protein
MRLERLLSTPVGVITMKPDFAVIFSIREQICGQITAI